MLLILSLALTLTVGVSCTSGETPFGAQVEGDGPTGEGGVVPTDGGDVPPGSSEAVPPDSSGAGPLNAGLLVCEPQAYAATTQVIGPSGGQISVGDHSLKIFENALSEDVTITAERIEGQVNSVRFSPEGLRFAIPAVLSLSYKNCEKVRHSKHIAYTDELLNVLESLLSLDFSSSSQVKTLIDHFSRYAVAY